MPKYIRVLAMVLTGLVLLCLLLAAIINDAYLWMGLLLAVPFVVLVLIVLGVTYGAYPTLKKSFSAPPKKSKSKMHPFIKRTAQAGTALLVLGGLILLLFVLSGGPNKGQGKHIFNNASNPYLDMHIGIVLLLLGCSFAITAHILATVTRKN